jgi:hypothetical protein
MDGNATGRLVCVSVCLDMAQARVQRTLLGAFDIPVFLFDEGMAQTAWQYEVALGGIRLMVPSIYAEESRALLAGYLSTADDRETQEQDAEGEICLKCGSDDIAHLYSWFSALFTLIAPGLPVPVLVVRARRSCRTCSHAWLVFR